ncbi:hypothetical protein BTW07_13735 [Salinicola socius]|uniref:Capsule biosynthesis protein n=2 Tax=Salinicola socius TaxID=404433 RepID=A0A1Q8SQI2_9GAMM|nr:hypothetical protein BTW07_13735 [Salinicola socius]
MESSKPIFLYIPWIAEHTNTLIDNIQSEEDYTLAPLDFVADLNTHRREVLRFARENPDTYRKMIVRRLIPLRPKLAGIIFTFDWAPVMRVIAHVCEELSIPRILIPHESVFVDKTKYYWDPKSYASQPLADVILGWGDLQKSIFVERGYPASRFFSVGAPKFDKYTEYLPNLSRPQYFRLFGLSPAQKTVLFASQPLDSQLNMRVARESQRKAIGDLLTACESLEYQLIVRLPPSKDNILGAGLEKRLVLSSYAAIDDALCYLVPPEEAIYHSDVVASVNSTMMFEGFLMGKMPLSTKYVDFDQIWAPCRFPLATNLVEIKRHLETYMAEGFVADQAGMEWAASQFSNGSFDGRSTTRIRDYLIEAARPGVLTPQLSPLNKVFNRERVDIIAIPSSDATWHGVQRYLLPMLNANQRIQSNQGKDSIIELASVDLFVQWGITEKLEKKKQMEARNALGRELVILEDGFIRSVGIGLSGEPGLSIILDDTTSYYDATKPSRLERLLQSGPELTEQEMVRAEALIAKIVEGRVSKYNHAPDAPLSIGNPQKLKILLLDQRRGDQSVVSGMADEATFRKMLQDAIHHYPNHDILIKQHPDAITGGKGSYFDNQSLAFIKNVDNVFLIDFDINPHALFDVVEEVHVVTSGMGFEALMAGKKVHCYGMPFYAGWELTEDRLQISRRSRQRRLTDVFHFAYVDLSRYYNPDLGRACDLEEAIDYIVLHR